MYSSCSDSSEFIDEDLNVLTNSVVTKNFEEPVSRNLTTGTYLLIHMFGGREEELVNVQIRWN